MRNDCMPRMAVTAYGHLDRQYLVHFYRRPDNTEDRMQRIEAANKSEWKNPRPDIYDANIYRRVTNTPYLNRVYHDRMPWKYDFAWIMNSESNTLILASVKKNIVKRKDHV